MCLILLWVCGTGTDFPLVGVIHASSHIRPSGVSWGSEDRQAFVSSGSSRTFYPG